MKKIFFFCWIATACFSQKIIVLKNEKINFQTPEFHIETVESKSSKKENIGFVFDKNGEKESVFLKNGIEKSFQSLFKKSNISDSLSSKILYHINNFSLTERKKTDKEIAGKFELLVSFEKINSEDTVALFEQKFEKSYVRSFGNDGFENFDSLIRQLATQSINYFGAWYQKNSAIHEAFIRKSQIILLPEILIEDEDTLCFGVREITWEDFKAKKPPITRFSGAIFPNISYSANYFIEKNTLIAKIETKVYMVKGMSWIKPESRNDYALNHEKLHFKIAKVIMDDFRKKVSTFQATNVTDLQSMIQLQYLDSYRDMNRLQEQYDKETNHGLNESKQKEWEGKYQP